jgi:hypothetical protein
MSWLSEQINPKAPPPPGPPALGLYFTAAAAVGFFFTWVILRAATR